MKYKAVQAIQRRGDERRVEGQGGWAGGWGRGSFGAGGGGGQ